MMNLKSASSASVLLLAIHLPTVILVHARVVSFGSFDLSSIVACSQVNRTWYAATCHPNVWKHVVFQKFGAELVQATEPLYRNNKTNDNNNVGSWRVMVMDDNKRGALPTVTIQQTSNVKQHFGHGYYACLVHSLKWDRVSNQLQLHLDARGEFDLRLPKGSSLVWRPRSCSPPNGGGEDEGVTRSRACRLIDW